MLVCPSIFHLARGRFGVMSQRSVGCCPAGTQVIYEVNVKCKDDETAKRFFGWLVNQGHVAEVMKNEGFSSAEVLMDAEDPLKLVARYVVDSMDDLEAYSSGPGVVLKKAGIEKFGDSFTATRRVLRSAHTVFK
ncbi:hypothetical protein FOZ60_009759 [Perkinsus olseni]|uniref:Uncharacterized protein n=1 Tax=Perkinsus olseni TaxID=32597 RepID=A0A7J6NGL3_PEROL|nr:hypothetical protein FOZ60_009759 [Perkinsus olseni]